jgi:hypothetical protein
MSNRYLLNVIKNLRASVSITATKFTNCETFIDTSWKMTEFEKSFIFSKLLMIIVLVVASSYADLPPIGDANCKEESCNSVNCESGIDCSLGKLMGDPKSICGCCKLCLNYIGKKGYILLNPIFIKLIKQFL